MNNFHRFSKSSQAGLMVCLFAITMLGGCGRDMSDLETWVQEEKAKRVPFRNDLPEVTPYESFSYSASNLRSPFQPSIDRSKAPATNSGIAPDRTRNQEHLESFALDSLRMVGSLKRENSNAALIQTTDGLIHQVRLGNYIGENDGRVIAITDSSVEIIEIVPDGLGGYVEREAGISLSD